MTTDDVSALARLREKLAGMHFPPVTTGMRKLTSEYGDSVLCLLSANSLTIAHEIEQEDADALIASVSLARFVADEEAVERLCDAAFADWRKGSERVPIYERAVVRAILEAIASAGEEA